MRNIRSLVVLVVAITAGIVAVFLASRWLTEQAGTAGGAKVVVAAADVDLGTQLTPQLLLVVDWPKGSVPQGAFSDPLELLEKQGTQPARVLRINVQKGEPILETKLAPVGTKGGLSSVIAAGKRAMTVSVNEIYGVAGFALPGNYVDILANTQDDKAKEISKQISKIVLENVLVLAVAQEARRDETKPRVVNAVTLEVTPEQAERIDLARSVGTLTLVLRNQVDKTPSETKGVRKTELLARSAAAPETETQKADVQKVAPKTPVAKRVRTVTSPQSKESVEVIRGTAKTNETLNQDRK